MAHILSKRAYTYIAVLLAIIFLISLIAGCGNDTVTGGNNNPIENERLLFTMDSFNLSGTGNIHKDTIFNFIDTVYDSLKCTFTISSNCVDFENAVFNITPGNNGLLYNFPNLNQSYTVYTSKNDTFWFALYSGFNTSNNRYIKASNIKLYLR